MNLSTGSSSISHLWKAGMQVQYHVGSCSDQCHVGSCSDRLSVMLVCSLYSRWMQKQTGPQVSKRSESQQSAFA